jgi:hypothetical protein
MYYNNSNRKFLDAYNKTLEEQKTLRLRSLAEEMGHHSEGLFNAIRVS